jgi:hypothetical protein
VAPQQVAKEFPDGGEVSREPRDAGSDGELLEEGETGGRPSNEDKARGGAGTTSAADAGSGGQMAVGGRSGTPSVEPNASDGGPKPPPEPATLESVMVDDGRPLLLFSDGSACMDAEFVVEDLDSNEHREKYPNSWMRWKKVNGKIAIAPEGGDTWLALETQTVYRANEKGLTLKDSFVIVRSSIASAIQSNEAAAYTFNSDGTYSGLYCSNGPITPATATSGGACIGQSDSIPGEYEIEDYTIRLVAPNVTSVRPFFYATEEPTTIFVGAQMYRTNRP